MENKPLILLASISIFLFIFGIVSIPSADALIPVSSFEFGISSTVEINDGTANDPVLSDFDNFGASVANIGDLDGDGVSDIAVGARVDNGGGTNRGAIHIMFMNTDGSVDSTVEINDSTANDPVLSDFDNFGASVANIGDLDGDGVSDIAVGAPADDNGGSNRGAIHILFSDVKNKFADNVFRIIDDADNTKEIAFEASNISPSTTRTFTLPDTNGTITLLEAANTFTGAQTINGKLDIGNSGITNDYGSFTIHHTADSGGGFFIQKDGNDPFFAFTGFDFEPGNRRIVAVGGGGWNVEDANEIQFWTDATYTGGINEGVQRMIIKNDGNIGIGTNAPDASAILEVSSTTQGFLPPTMTTQRDAIVSPAAGLLIYNTNTNQWEGYNGTSWVSLN